MDANKDVKRLIIVSPMMWLIIGAAVFALASPGAMMYVMAGVGGLLSIRVLHSLVAPAVRDAAARWRKAGG